MNSISIEYNDTFGTLTAIMSQVKVTYSELQDETRIIRISDKKLLKVLKTPVFVLSTFIEVARMADKAFTE